MPSISNLRYLALLLTGVLALGACSGEPETNMSHNGTPHTTALVGGTALVGTELVAVPDAVVLLKNGLIAAVGSADEVTIPDHAELIDVAGMTIVPGLIDAHVHMGFAPGAEVLAGGITTVRDLAWPPELIWPLVETSEDPTSGGPLIVAAGQMLTADGGYPMTAGWAPPGTGLVVRSPADAAAAVQSQVDAGAVVIKIALNPPVGPTLPADTLAAIVKAAHHHSLKVTGHIYGLDELDKAIAAGVDELAHMLMSPDVIPDDTIKAMVDAGVTIVPTLSVRSGGDLEIAISNLAKFRAAGGHVVYGTDLGNAGPQPGFDPVEIEGMRRAGFDPHAILMSATVEAARLLGLDDRGVLEVGAVADIVVLGGDPLHDTKDLTNIQMVWREGIRAR